MTFKVPSTRGKIFDVYGRLCAYDEIVYSAYLDVDFLKSRFKERLMPHLKLLIANFSLPYSPEQLLSNSKRFVKLGQAKERDELLSKVPTELIPFVSIEYETVRKRFEDYGMGKILGKVIDGKGFGGVEEALNSTLARQKDGKIRIRYKGFLTTTLVIETIASPRNGKDISLTIDLDLQKIAYEEIKNAVQKNRAVSGGVIILETKTGKIRAMVTTREWNDAIMGYFEPGSAIKPIVYAIALEEKIVDLQTIFQCEGKIKPIDDVDIVVRDLYVHGKVDLTEALVESCNSATILLARQIKEKLGDYNYYQWLEKFGFGKPTKVQLAGEISGVLRKPESWSKIDFAMISIGQSIGTTPLQFAAAFNTIANRGVYVAPTIIEDFETEKRKVLSPEVCDKIVQILHQVVERGTGVRAKVPNVGIAGKTGTAQKVAAGEDKYYSIFAGFFPYEDPQYTILVWLDEPSANAYLAGEVAAPIFAKIVQRITKLSREQVISFQEGLMPDLRGLTVKDALFILKQLNVEEIEIVGTGIVKNQYPPPGSVELEKVILFLGY
ncbi:penicillin-binding protein [Pseudothermotoga thermarum]|uniref:penicillin-binding protein n=1 Tax=Pseudothermotoga thermarum TaxID=119394 RepID=UPI001FE02FCB|nr:penicillin-binding protein [Pseudothermotoga thermarum]